MRKIMINKIFKSFFLLSIIIALSSCALFRSNNEDKPNVTFTKGQTVELPSPLALNFNLTATQILTAEYIIKGKKDSYSSQVEIEKNGDKLIMVALGGWGGEIFSIKYNGQKIQSSSLPMPHASMGIKYALTDFILTYAPESVLKKMLQSTNITMQIKPLKRIFILNDKPIISIEYGSKNPWKGKVYLQNFIYHYTISIDTLSVKNT